MWGVLYCTDVHILDVCMCYVASHFSVYTYIYIYIHTLLYFSVYIYIWFDLWVAKTPRQKPTKNASICKDPIQTTQVCEMCLKLLLAITQAS